ncbi:MAG TPA: hypothetical protein VIC26_12675, partial [Marinagarivorans sp.]
MTERARQQSGLLYCLHVVVALLLAAYSWWVFSTGQVIVSGKLYGDIYELGAFSKYMICGGILSAAA